MWDHQQTGPVANLYTITSIDSAVDLTIDVWVLTVATVGAGAVEAVDGGCRLG